MTIDELRTRTGIPPITSTIKQRKLSWYGHIKRSSLPVRTIYEGMIPGIRKRGRPTRRWRDDIKDWTNKSIDELNIMTKCRNDWRNYISNIR